MKESLGDLASKFKNRPYDSIFEKVRMTTMITQTHQELVKRIRDAVREKTQATAQFKDGGAIRILLYPTCRAADKWLGGLGDFESLASAEGFNFNDSPDYEYVFAAVPGGSRIRKNKRVGSQIDCYAFSAMKIAHCSYAQDVGAGLKSGITHLDDACIVPFLDEEYGFAPYLGAICIEVGMKGVSDVPPNRHVNEFCLIYVSVSGATEDEDLRCAKAAIDAVADFFEGQGDFEVLAPVLE